MKKIFKYIILLTSVSALTGCISEFENYNTNPYQPTSISLASYMPGMIDCMASAEENPCQRNNTFWACFGGYVMTPHDWSKKNHFYLYNADDDWNQWSFNWYFSEHIYPNWFAVNRATGGKGYYFAMAQLFRIYTMQMIASFQGPLPYSEVKLGDFYVPYDNEETVWKAMLDDLDKVIEEIQAAIDANYQPADFAAVDRVYSGDNKKWLKFANTLKLRMAMRISGKDVKWTDPNDRQKYVIDKVKEAVDGGVMTVASDGAYDNLNNRYQNGYYVLDKGWGGEVKANACIVSYLKSFDDPRIEKYIYPDTKTGEYTGLRSGVAGRNKGLFTSYSGVIWGSDDKYKYAPMPIMLASEAAFLMAEAALNGWIGGDAKTYYESGIKLSFEEWGASLGTYMTNEFKQNTQVDGMAAKYHAAGVAWDASNALEQIITQKWIAGFPNGLEAWSDFRRTGYPYIFPAKDNRSNTLGYGVADDELGQRRLRFPQSEYDKNAANVEAAAKLLPGGKDNIDVNLWWAQSDNKYKN